MNLSYRWQSRSNHVLTLSYFLFIVLILFPYSSNTLTFPAQFDWLEVDLTVPGLREASSIISFFLTFRSETSLDFFVILVLFFNKVFSEYGLYFQSNSDTNFSMYILYIFLKYTVLALFHPLSANIKRWNKIIFFYILIYWPRYFFHPCNFYSFL